MYMKTVFLGTSSMVPTKRRNVTGIYTEHNGSSLLIDCGEGTQRQLNKAGINRHRITCILISHWHGDHVSGLMGLLQTMGNIPNPKTLHIVGPKGTKKHFNHLRNASASPITMPVDVKEIRGDEENVFDDGVVSVDAYTVKHGVPCLGYVVKQHPKRKIKMEVLQQEGVPSGPHIKLLQEGKDMTYEGKMYDADTYTYIEEGPKVGFLLDTALCDGVRRVMQNVKTVICESTFTSEHEDRAVKYNHMTAEQVAKAANEEGIENLFLTHFSQRYPDTDVVLSEAKEYFENTVCASDFMEIITE